MWSCSSRNIGVRPFAKNKYVSTLAMHLTACPICSLWPNYTHMGCHLKHVCLYQTLSRTDCKGLKWWAHLVNGQRYIEVFLKVRYSDLCYSTSLLMICSSYHFMDLWIIMPMIITCVMIMTVCVCASTTSGDSFRQSNIDKFQSIVLSRRYADDFDINICGYIMSRDN